MKKIELYAVRMGILDIAAGFDEKLGNIQTLDSLVIK